jgi:hypothetical protein
VSEYRNILPMQQSRWEKRLFSFFVLLILGVLAANARGAEPSKRTTEAAIRDATTIIELERGYDIGTHKPGIRSLTKLVRDIYYPGYKVTRDEVIRKAGVYLRNRGYYSDAGNTMKPGPALLIDTVENWKRQSPFEL